MEEKQLLFIAKTRFKRKTQRDNEKYNTKSQRRVQD